MTSSTSVCGCATPVPRFRVADLGTHRAVGAEVLGALPSQMHPPDEDSAWGLQEMLPRRSPTRCGGCGGPRRKTVARGRNMPETDPAARASAEGHQAWKASTPMDRARNPVHGASACRPVPARRRIARRRKELTGGFWQHRESGDRLCRGGAEFGGFREAVNKQFGAVESSAASTGKRPAG